MKKQLLFISLTILIAGCQEETKKPVSVQNLKFDMQLYQVQDICQKPLLPSSSEAGDGCTLSQYRGWLWDGVTVRNTIWGTSYPSSPYRLIFQVLPPMTKEQCLEHISQQGYTDPNDVKAILALEGISPSKLIKIELDETYLALKAASAGAAASNQQQKQHQNQQQQRLRQMESDIQQIERDTRSIETQRMFEKGREQNQKIMKQYGF